jgi:hypothetical protein
MKKLLLAAFGLVSLFGFNSRAMAHDYDCDHDRGRDCYSYRRDRDDARCRWEEERRRHHHDGRCDDDRRWDEYHHHGVRGFLEGFVR